MVSCLLERLANTQPVFEFGLFHLLFYRIGCDQRGNVKHGPVFVRKGNDTQWSVHCEWLHLLCLIVFCIYSATEMVALTVKWCKTNSVVVNLFHFFQLYSKNPI